jgi:hypothetical protein
MAGNIFISYRRDDDAGFALLIHRELVQEFPHESVFMDVEGHIKPGDDFKAVLNAQVTQCDVMLAVIGERWIDVRDENGKRRLDKDDDFVRIEIASALGSDKRVIPVLVNKAEMPPADKLPLSLRPLAQRQAIAIRRERSNPDIQGLISALKKALEETEREKKRSEAELAAAKAAREQREKEEKDRAQRMEEEKRERALRGWTPQDIRKAEELVNWKYIEDSTRPEDFRDHIARFAGGATERPARRKLEALVWAEPATRATRDALLDFLREFPDGVYAAKARAMTENGIARFYGVIAAGLEKVSVPVRERFPEWKNRLGAAVSRIWSEVAGMLAPAAVLLALIGVVTLVVMFGGTVIGWLVWAVATLAGGLWWVVATLAGGLWWVVATLAGGLWWAVVASWDWSGTQITSAYATWWPGLAAWKLFAILWLTAVPAYWAAWGIGRLLYALWERALLVFGLTSLVVVAAIVVILRSDPDEARSWAARVLQAVRMSWDWTWTQIASAYALPWSSLDWWKLSAGGMLMLALGYFGVVFLAAWYNSIEKDEGMVILRTAAITLCGVLVLFAIAGAFSFGFQWVVTTVPDRFWE